MRNEFLFKVTMLMADESPEIDDIQDRVQAILEDSFEDCALEVTVEKTTEKN